MNRVQRALQIWQVLIGAAYNRQILTYEMLAEIIGVGPEGKGAGILGPNYLGILMEYCANKGLPPITLLVVKKDTGMPGVGLKTVEDLPKDREKVFNLRWFELVPLSAHDVEPFARSSHRQGLPASEAMN